MSEWADPNLDPEQAPWQTLLALAGFRSHERLRRDWTQARWPRTRREVGQTKPPAKENATKKPSLRQPAPYKKAKVRGPFIGCGGIFLYDVQRLSWP